MKSLSKDDARDTEGAPLIAGRRIAGRRIAGVTDKQLEELGIKMTPMHPETELRNAGAVYESQSAFLDFFATHVAIDDERRFVTGQNQNSAHETAYKMMVLVSEAQRQRPPMMRTTGLQLKRRSSPEKQKRPLMLSLSLK